MTTVQDAIDRMRAIDTALPASDGVAVFNRVYLQVTEGVLAALSAGDVFEDDAFMAELDVRFADLWFAAYDSSPGDEPKAWAPLFEQRSEEHFPIQFALAGINAHIEHDLAVAVVETCEAQGREPREVRDDYEKVNDLLGSIEADIRRQFMTELEREVDARITPIAHLVASWNIDKARDLAWVNVCLLWELRRSEFFSDLHKGALARTVGLGSRLLLAPCVID